MLATWPNLVKLPYTEDNVTDSLDDEDDLLQTAHKTIQGAANFITNIKRSLNKRTRMHYNMKLQEDALTDNMKTSSANS